jgi:hypothetical protein
VARSRAKDNPAAQKKAEQEKRQIVFVDESGFYLLPMAVRTYAPMGKTPVLRVPLTRDHISAIGALTPEGRLFMQTQVRSYKDPDVEHQQGSVIVDLVVDAVALHLDERSCAPCQAFAATPTNRLADLLQQLIGERRKVRPLSLVLLDLSPAGTSGHGMPRLKARRSSQRFSAR